MTREDLEFCKNLNRDLVEAIEKAFSDLEFTDEQLEEYDIPSMIVFMAEFTDKMYQSYVDGYIDRLNLSGKEIREELKSKFKVVK